MGPVAPMAGASGAAPARAGGADQTVTALNHESFAVAESAGADGAEPMTWAQLATHDQARVTPGPAATDPGHTAV